MRGERIQRPNKSGPSLARQRNAITMAFRWRADDGPTLNAGRAAGIRTNFAKKPYIFCDFRGGGGVRTSALPSGSAHYVRQLYAADDFDRRHFHMHFCRCFKS